MKPVVIIIYLILTLLSGDKINWYDLYLDPEEDFECLAPPEIYGTITTCEIADLMPKEFTNPNNDDIYETRMGFVSSEYELTSKEEIQRFLTCNVVNKSGLSARVGRGNCKWYALALWGDAVQWYPGLAFGYISLFDPSPHAKNVAITLDDGEINVWEIEPQSDVMEEMYVKTILCQRYEF